MSEIFVKMLWFGLWSVLLLLPGLGEHWDAEIKAKRLGYLSKKDDEQTKKKEPEEILSLEKKEQLQWEMIYHLLKGIGYFILFGIFIL